MSATSVELEETPVAQDLKKAQQAVSARQNDLRSNVERQARAWRDDPGLDYCEVASELQRVRGPYPTAAGVAAYEKHLRQHRHPANAARGAMTDAGDRR